MTNAELLKVALDIATKAHSGQTRWDKKTPYVTHPIAVAEAFERPYERMVALLHDVIEDTAVTASNLKDKGIPDDVIIAVETMSHRSNESYAMYLGRVKTNTLASKVKTSDLLHNLSDLDSKRNKQRLDKYLLALKLLNPRTLADVDEEALQNYTNQNVFSLNTGKRGKILEVKSSERGADILVGWSDESVGLVWHVESQAIGLIE
jgi:hypothetical protein